MSGEEVGLEELLAAGAVLPPGTEGLGERAVPLTARAYRHPGLADRVVVRLVAAELGAAEDLAAGFLGLLPHGEPEPVGFGPRAALGFPEWVLVHHPGDGHHALAVVPEMRKTAQRAGSKPKVALDGFHELAGRLAAAVPHLLPTFYEQAGREFLAVENLTYAAQMFTHARKAEVEHGLALDEERLDAVFLEFALAGALPVKTLSGYARELAARVPPDEALRRFTRLCVRRTAGGMPPSAQVAAELRRLARASGAEADEVERGYLAEVLTLPSVTRAASGWWKAHRQALAVLAGLRPEVRGALLDLMPTGGDEELPGLWLEILEESGATAALLDPAAAPEETRPQDGSTGWLKRFLAFRGTGWWPAARRVPGLYALVERMAGQLRAELAASGTSLEVPVDIDLLDLLLSLDVPVADPKKDHTLFLDAWARYEGQRDLVALAADPRFRDSFRRGADRFGSDGNGQRGLRLLAASPGGRPMLADWIGEVARRSVVAGLPDLPEALGRFGWLPGEALALAEEEVRAAVTADLAPILGRTLRAGLLDELSWPAWEEAAIALVPKGKPGYLVIADAWPYLIVAGSAQARVIGPEGTVLVHDLRIPANDVLGVPGFHYVDGELFVHWRSSRQGRKLIGYWHTTPDHVQSLEGDSTWGTRVDWYNNDHAVTLPLPGGGRTTGTGVLHRGDTRSLDGRDVITDGTSYWVWAQRDDEDSHGWYEYDPVSGKTGRRSMPGFFTDGARNLPAGSEFHAGSLLTVSSPEATPAGTPVDGLLGWRSHRLPDGSACVEDLTGNRATVPSGRVPSGLLFLPGDDRPRGLVHHHYTVALTDPDGVSTSVARTDSAPGKFAEGTPVLPPSRFWHCLRPRDPRGSAALRRIDRETVAALLKAASADDVTSDGLIGAVRAVLPEVTHEGLLAGVAGVVRHAAAQQASLDRTSERLERTLAEGAFQDGPAGPADLLINEALDGLDYAGRWWNYGVDGETPLFGQLRLVKRVLATGDLPKKARIHLDGIELPSSKLRLASLLDCHTGVTFRATSTFTAPEHREALRELLREFEELGLLASGEPARWRRFRLHLDKTLLTQPSGEMRGGHWKGLLPLEDRAFLMVPDYDHMNGDGEFEFTALFHDPSGRFEVPAPYTVRSSAPLTPEGAVLPGGFLAEADERGPAPWFPEAAEEFSRLTGVPPTLAKLVVAGMPGVGSSDRNFLPAEVRAVLGVKAADAALARDELRRLDSGVRRSLVGALLPADPARLWTDGPDVTAAAEVWNAAVGRRAAVPEALLSEAAKAVRTGWDAGRALPALLDPAAEPQLSHDLAWTVRGDHAEPEDEKAVGFTATTLVTTVALTAWLAHRLPAGDPIRAALPAALAAVRERLAHPGLMLGLSRYVNLPEFRKTAGAPTEIGEGFERYGAVVMATADELPYPAIRTALLDPAGHDPYLAVLRGDSAEPLPAEVALRTAKDERFAALLADPGEPVAGERDKDGTWWPQDPSRSVPDLVTEAAGQYGLGQDAAVLYLMLLAMPDPTDRDTSRWTGWRPARIKAARAELAATDLVVEARRTRAGRSLFLPGGWTDTGSPRPPLEEWKLPLYDLAPGGSAPLDVLVPTEPLTTLYRRTWQRITEGDRPRFAELRTRRARRRLSTPAASGLYEKLREEGRLMSPTAQVMGVPARQVLPAEERYATELAFLAAHDSGPRPPGWTLTPRAVVTFICGGGEEPLRLAEPEEGVPDRLVVAPKFVGERALVERCVVTLAGERGLLLVGEPGTAKSMLSELLAAAVCGTSALTVQGTAGTTEDAFRYGWNYALLLAQGPTPQALVASPVLTAMRAGRVARIEEITRCLPEVQDALVSILSDRRLSVPELAGGEDGVVSAAPGFTVIATANLRDRGVSEMSAALKRRFNFETVEPIADADAETALVRSQATAAVQRAGAAFGVDDAVLDALVTVFRDLRSGSSAEGWDVERPGTVMSTAEAVQVAASLAIATAYLPGGDVLDLVPGHLLGVVRKDDPADHARLLGYWDGPVRRRAEDGSAMWRRLWDLRETLR